MEPRLDPFTKALLASGATAVTNTASQVVSDFAYGTTATATAVTNAASQVVSNFASGTTLSILGTTATATVVQNSKTDGLNPADYINITSLLTVTFATGGKLLDLNYKKKTNLIELRSNKKIELEKQKKDEEIKLNKAQKELKDKLTELKETNNQIAQQEEKLFEIRNVNNNTDIKFIILLGITGDGKSTLGNRLLGDKSDKGNKGPFKAAKSGKPVTTSIKHKTHSINDTICVIVDTPGKNDKNDIHNKNNLIQYLYGCGGVNAFILVKNGTNSRFDNNLASIMKEYEKDFGIRFWNHLIVVLTRIEGDECDDFSITKKEFMNELYNQFPNSQHAKISVFAIGRKLSTGEPYDFDEFNKDFINTVQNKKLECKKMVSPINTLRSKRNKLKKHIQDQTTNIVKLKSNIQNLENQIKNIDEKINNESYWVLGRNIPD